MQLKLFVLPVKNLAAAEAEMNAFLRGHRVLAVKKEFVPDGENSFWTFCVEYLDGAGVSSLRSLRSLRLTKMEPQRTQRTQSTELV
jgi:hypothetical protein